MKPYYLGLLLVVIFASCVKENYLSPQNYPLHTNITTTVFWIGEPGDESNKNIPNRQSVWDDKWQDHYGGVDDPEHRNGYWPAGFVPRENPFYCALPYNDFKDSGKRKRTALKRVYWANEKEWNDTESLCKNRWVKIIKNDTLVCYAQWEDAGPFGENDYRYVFGTQQPENTINEQAGLDVSPAVRDYLLLDGMEKVSWQFVPEADVPDGPWKQIITTSQVYWE